MKVLFQNRDPKAWGGGDIIREFSLMKRLQKAGIDCQFSSELQPPLQEFDLVHLFNLTWDWTINQALNCQRQNKPYIIDAIYHPGVPQASPIFREIGAKAKFVLAQSEMEAKYLTVLLDRGIYHTLIVKKGTDEEFFQKEPNTSPLAACTALEPILDRYVLSVGRVEDTKNQFNLVKACQKLSLPAVLIGSIDENYKAAIDKLGYGKVHFLGHILKEDLPWFYKHCLFYTQLSNIECFANTVLEAAAMGKFVLMSEANLGGRDIPGVSTVKLEDALIVSALMKMRSGENKAGSKYVKKNYNWKCYVDCIKRVYKEALK